jgi:ribosomal protein S18 acetylase RimI-like enzyme
MLALVRVTAAEDVGAVRELFTEYAQGVDEPCCFEGFERELRALPAGYERLILARGAGCVALRRLDGATAEIKRLYVRAAHRGSGLGRRLAETAIDAAREAGCSRVVLDSLPKMREAIALYRSLGFREIPPYLEQPTPGAICFELTL